jgi:hypothetical protein
MGVNITADEARARHSVLIEKALALAPNFMQGVTYT